MSHADSKMTREERRLLNRHLFQMHGRVDLTKRSPALTGEQLEQLHSTLHEDDWAFPPHSHPAAGQIENTYSDNYLEETIDIITGKDSE